MFGILVIFSQRIMSFITKLFSAVIVPLEIDYKACLESSIKLQVLVVLFVAFVHIMCMTTLNISISVSTKRTCVTMDRTDCKNFTAEICRMLFFLTCLLMSLILVQSNHQKKKKKQKNNTWKCHQGLLDFLYHALNCKILNIQQVVVGSGFSYFSNRQLRNKLGQKLQQDKQVCSSASELLSPAPCPFQA